MLICVFTGFSSGLPLYILINLLPNWLQDYGINLKTISLFALTSLPYTWKFFFAPALDAITLSTLGRRRSWMLLTQIILIALIAAYGIFTPSKNIEIIALISIAVAFCSALQDIAIDAFRREILSDRELGLGNAIHVNAYRIAQLIPGSLALFMADHLPWSIVFITTALFMLPGIFMTLVLATEPTLPDDRPRTIEETITKPFNEFFTRKGVQAALFVLLFMLFYKLGDSLATTLQSNFLRDMGYSKTHLAAVAKHAQLWPGIIGALLGGLWMLKLGINRALWIFGVGQTLTILGFAWLAASGPFPTIGTSQLIQLGLVIGAEYFTGGLGTAAFVAYIARETHPAYTATQLALLTSITALPRTLIGSSAGALIVGTHIQLPLIGTITIPALGYEHFFYFCFLLAIPGMLMLLKVAPWNAPNENT